ncbi:MAG TPA: efflux RND transporter periplasmic adaptor subunit [Verrucomicrobiota bacterium]|nr:efflux RND transporter periplasmic adaptor subunit [Verrucomicrobiota bacterium]
MAKNGKSSGIKWTILCVVAVVAAGGGYWFYKSRASESVQYQTVTVKRGSVTQVVTASGQLNPVVNVQVGSQISGRISKLYADFNSAVKQGQLIAEIEPSTFEAAVRRAKADLSSAKASLELAQLEARRAEQLFKQNLLSASEHDSAVASLHQAEAAMEIREAALNSAQVDLDRCKIYSPVDGIVISRSVDAGQTVAASMSAPELFRIASDLTKMQINANVAEADVGGVDVGQDVDFTVDAFPTRTFSGKVIQVRNSPVTVQNVVTYDTVIEVSNPDLKLKPGMTANVSIIIQHKENVLTIPNSVLRYRPPEEIVMTNALAQFPSPAVTNAGGPPRDMAAMSGEGRGRGPGSGGGGRNRAGGGRGAERQQRQTLYLWPGGDPQNPPGNLKLNPVRVRLGISDGIVTEIIEGVKEDDTLVASSTAPAAAQSQAGAQNPFSGRGGGMRRF